MESFHVEGRRSMQKRKTLFSLTTSVRNVYFNGSGKPIQGFTTSAQMYVLPEPMMRVAWDNVKMEDSVQTGSANAKKVTGETIASIVKKMKRSV